MLRVRLLHFNAVAVQYLVPHLQRVAGNAHNALDVVEAPILGVTEHDDVPDLGLDAADQVVVIERIPKAVEEFVDQQVIADLSVSSMEPDGILNACTTNVVRTRARATAQMSASAYSPITVLRNLWMRESCSFIKKGVLRESALQSLWERRMPFPGLAARAFEERSTRRGAPYNEPPSP